jgi:hypothetical protein
MPTRMRVVARSIGRALRSAVAWASAPRFRKRPSLSLVTGLALAATIGAACVTIHDPTEGTVTVQIVNDTRGRLRIGLCEDSKCKHIASGAATIGAGASFPQNVEARSKVPLAIQDVPSNHRRSTARCMVLTVRPKVHRRYRVNDLRPCRA